jgi:hypothetical protein
VVKRLALACVLVAGCTDDIVVMPVIEVPVDDPDAAAFPNLDEVIITVAHENSERDLVSASFSRGEDISIAGAPLGDDLVVHLAGFVGSSNIAYGRTCAFHVDANNAPPSPHLFFSRSVKFASLGIAPVERLAGRAVPYLGSAIVLGGEAGGAGVSEVERYDPSTGELTRIGDLDQRTGAALALLGTSPPRVVVVGGSAGGAGASWIELVDPSRRVERVDEVASPMPRVGLTATSLTDGRVIVIGGHSPIDGVPVGTITELAAGVPLDARTLRATLAHPRTGHTATRLGDDLGAPVLVAGGLDATGQPVGVAELFKPLSEELADPLLFKPTMVVPRTGHQAVRMPDNSVLIIGGVDGSTPVPKPVPVLELFTLDGGFKAVGNLPENAGLTDMTATVLPDGRVLITGGKTELGAVTNTAFIARLDPLDGTVDVVPTDRLAVPRANHQAAILCDGTILVTGGTAGPASAERYNPSAIGRR